MYVIWDSMYEEKTNKQYLILKKLIMSRKKVSRQTFKELKCLLAGIRALKSMSHGYFHKN